MTIPVVCALIVNDDGRVLAARRSSSMDLPGKWEFPGGKIEPGENEQDALLREIKEELDVVIRINEAIPPHVYHYDTKSILLIPFICSLISGQIILREHKSWDWFSHDQLAKLDWAEADIPILNEYLKRTEQQQ